MANRMKTKTDLHFVLLFWNHVLTCASVILSVLAREALSADARYFCLWNLFSSSQICMRVKLVRGFFLFGGVRFWYGCPMRRGGTGGRPAVRGKGTVKDKERDLLFQKFRTIQQKQSFLTHN